MKDRCKPASDLLSLSSKITNLDYTRQFKLVEYPEPNRVSDLLTNKSTPVTQYDKLLTFRFTDESFQLEGNLLNMITNNNYNVDLDKLPEKELLYEFAKEMYFDEKASGNKSIGNKSTRDETLNKLLNSPVIISSGISTIC